MTPVLHSHSRDHKMVTKFDESCGILAVPSQLNPETIALLHSHAGRSPDAVASIWSCDRFQIAGADVTFVLSRWRCFEVF